MLAKELILWMKVKGRAFNSVKHVSSAKYLRFDKLLCYNNNKNNHNNHNNHNKDVALGSSIARAGPGKKGLTHTAAFIGLQPTSCQRICRMRTKTDWNQQHTQQKTTATDAHCRPHANRTRIFFVCLERAGCKE